ncbi:1455_t:CDS:2, partial [Funneliformis caledonium]
YIVEMSLFFVALTHPLPNPSLVDIAEVMKNTKDDVFSLTLWKIEDLYEENAPKWEELTTLVRSYTETDIEKFGGKKLSSTKKFIEEFSVVPENRVHILVQFPPPATAGKRKLEYSDEDNVKKDKLMDFQEKNKNMIKLLIENLDSIDTNQQAFNVPPLPLPGEVDKIAIYNRKCYNYYRNLILNNESHNRFLITGNPGIGKIYFGRLMLVELLKKGNKVIFDCKDCTLYINLRGESFTVDSKKEYLLLAQGKFIMVSSHKRDIIGDFDKQKCKTLYMQTWNEEELLKCWDKLYKVKISEETIKKKFRLCGGVPRWIFDNDMSYKKIYKMIVSASESFDQNILDYQAKLFIGHEFSHKIIHIHTNSEETKDPYTDAFCLFASKYAASKCLDHLKKHNKEKLRTFIDSARNIKEMSALQGQLFELLSHEILRWGGKFLVRKLTERGAEPEEFEEFESDLKEIFFWSIDEITGDIQQGQKNYYRPDSDTFESIDSYVYPNKMFQITVSRRHGVKQDGLRAIKEVLDEDSDINIYFVVPKDKFGNFKTKQPYENKGDGKKFDVWINKIVQYALCIDFDKYCGEL